MTLRITPHRQLELAQQATQRQNARASTLQNQISSGERINRPSEDPEASRLILTQKRAVSRLETQLTSIEYARSYLNQANVEVLDANRLVVQAKSLTLQARQATEQSELDVIASELGGYLRTFETIANAELDGRYLFGGTANDQPPFSGIVTGNTLYQGSQQQGEVVLPNESDIPVFRSGKNVFEFTAEDGTRSQLFDLIHNLKSDIENRSNLDSETWGARIDDHIANLDRASDHLLSVTGEQSVSLQQLDRLQQRTEDLKFQSEKLLSETQSPDFAAAVVQLQEEQNLLQYSLATITRIFEVSVLDFLS